MDDLLYERVQHGGRLAGTSHPSQAAPSDNAYWLFRRGSPHEASPAPRRPLRTGRARVVQDGCSALAAALHVEPYGAVAWLAGRLQVSKQAVRVWADTGHGARRFVARVADLVELFEGRATL
ncbi:MAG: hypothetical protein GXY85_05375 [Candidatus Brocadiaceae bacterium]|nr:hypothetical protein [Candidatus Brocadiaceae bacterium]